MGEYHGRIARKGIACMKTMIDDKRIEVVMLVKWDMDPEDIQRVMEDAAVIYDGEFEPELEKESKEDELVAPLLMEEKAPAEKVKEDERCLVEDIRWAEIRSG